VRARSYPRPVSASRTAAAPPGEPPSGERDGGGVLERAEVRDVLAWTRLLIDPTDAAAVVRALARPPIELGQTDLARVIQIARRRKLDIVSALALALELPQVPPDARERIQRFLDLHEAAAAALDGVRPDLLARMVLGGEREDPEAKSPPAGEGVDSGRLRETQQMMREEVLASVARIGGRLGEMRLDTDLDISHGVVRYLELLKLSALQHRPPGESIEEALADLNARLLAAATPLEREIFQTSSLDEMLLAGEGEGAPKRIIRSQLGERQEPSLAPFLPRKGIGLALSASDVETYRSCPLRYKFARVLRIPTAQTLHQRFGIAVHHVLERYHSDGGRTLEQMLDLLDSCWRRGGFGDSEPERELREKARLALERYHARLQDEQSEPVWFERSFSFRLGPHHVRGRVDRVDRLAPGGGVEYELIDYKTSRPKDATELQDDVQLSLYALAAREAWQLESSRQAYHYVLDDRKVPVPRGEDDLAAVKETVLTVGEGILAERFEPTPSQAVCRLCDYRLACPVAER
jgi:DNA helicase II / ATP-dependent DNA helicase PcrA